MKQKIGLTFQMLLFAIIFFTIESCDPADNRLKIVNNSNTDIYFFYSCDSSLNNLNLFKTGYYRNSIGDSTFITSDHLINKRADRKVPMRGLNAWEQYLNNCNNKEIYIYIFLDSIVNKFPPDEISKRRMYEKCFNYNAYDLKQINWTIVYP